MTTTKTPLNITIEPVEVSDYPILSEIDAAGFEHLDLSVVAFGARGPVRDEEEEFAQQFEEMDMSDGSPMQHVRNKAVLHHPSGGSEIIGFTDWGIVTSRDLPAEEEHQAKEKAKWEKMSPEERQRENEWGPDANLQLCEDSFGRAAKIMYACTEGEGYCELNTLAISQAHQRKGVGAMLLEHGLAKVDSLGLQSILMSTPEAEKLYEKYDFKLIHEMEFNLWEYKGGEGMQGKTARLVVMRRPPKAVNLNPGEEA